MKSFRMPVLTGMLVMAGLLTACGGSSSSDDNSGGSSSSATTAASLDTIVPSNGETSAYVDTTLQITFDSAPTIGDSGFIYVYKADGTLVDKISPNVFNTGSWVSDATAETAGITAETLATWNTQTAVDSADTEIDRLGGNVTTLQSSSEELYRWVFYKPITISDNVATIKLHDGKLEAGTTYYVTMDSGVLDGTIDGLTFQGISDSSAWTFTTKSDPTSTTAITVAASGTDADFRSVQGALDWLMQNCAGTATNDCNSSTVAKTITIADGTYDGLLWIRGLNDLTISGATRDGVVVEYENFEHYNPGTGGSATLTKLTGTNLTETKAQTESDGYRPYLGGGRPVLLVESADQLTLNQFTLQNTHVKDSNENNQAETIYFNSSSLSGSRLSATYMNFISAQDTIQIKGWSWFYNSLIAGNVDFIWGEPFAALFENSELRTVADTTSSTSGGYVIESRAAYGYPGFVVFNSSLTRESDVPDGATYLARQASDFSDTTTYCNTMLTSGSLAKANYGCNNVAYINTTMGDHIASAGWLYSHVPPITTATSTEGYRESGSLDSSTGAALDVTGRDLTYASTTADLSSLETRDDVFSSWNSDTGWTPTADTCSSTACTTSK